MRAEDAIYGGEMSAHHYFREFAYCDSGMIPWLLVAQRRLFSTGRSPRRYVGRARRGLPVQRGEINFAVEDAKAAVARVLEFYSNEKPVLGQRGRCPRGIPELAIQPALRQTPSHCFD